MKPESKFWGDIRDNLLGCVDWLRVENLVSAGPPDVNGCLEGREIWMELKIMTNGRLTLRHSQYQWFFHRVFKARAENVFLVARTQTGIVAWEGREFFMRARATRQGDERVKKDWRARIDDEGMTFDPGIPQFVVDHDDSQCWNKLGEFVFGPIYRTIFVRSVLNRASHDKVG